MINNWHAGMQHGETCLCERCLLGRRRAAARERIHAELDAERKRQADMIAGAMAALEEITVINADGAPIQVNYKHGEPVLRSCDTVTGTDDDLFREPAKPVKQIEVTAIDDTDRAFIAGTGGIFGVTRIRETAPGVWKPDPAGTHVIQPPQDQHSGTGPFICPGCGFSFASRTAAMTSCQYCGQVFPALVTELDPGSCPGPGCPCGGSPGAHACTDKSQEHQEKLAPDPVTELTAAIREPLGLDGAALDTLAPYGTVAPGCCRTCHQPAGGGVLCWYCTAAHQAQVADKDACYDPSPVAAELASRTVTCRHGKKGSFIRDGRCQRCGRYAVRPAAVHRQHSLPGQVVLLLTACALFWAGVFLFAPLILLGFVFLVAAVKR